MKQKDILIIVVIVFFSAIVSFLVSRLIFVAPQNRQQSVEVVQPITADFDKPDSRYFNDQAFDPAQPITIEQNANPNPFSSTSQ
ncbi:MAG TPA: hypothetical protein VM535_01280 [Candidatus Saccharimonadales bacterium]|nr:hypothetical protein [Candidatus Saccharimonadales bacterium]